MWPGGSFVPVPSGAGLAADARGWRASDAVAWAVLASLLLHAAFLIAATRWRGTATPPPIEANIPVELLTPEQYDAATQPASLPGPAATAPAAPSRNPPGDMIRPTVMLSAGALADPKSRQAREMLPHFEGTERMVQLCNLEAMEQVHAWRPDFRPERIIAYAMGNLAIAGDRIAADGAAFLSGERWYNLGFDCALSADHERVVAFDFRVGEPVPEAELASHNLPLGD